jgi:hypothetical protein
MRVLAAELRSPQARASMFMMAVAYDTLAKMLNRRLSSKDVEPTTQLQGLMKMQTVQH